MLNVIDPAYATECNWDPALDPPEAHPLWERQVALEREMMKAGADKFRDQVLIAKRRGQLTRVKPFRGLLSDWVPMIAEEIGEWLKAVDRTTGPRPISYPLVLALSDRGMAALAACRAVLNATATGKLSLVRVCVDIGRTIEHEEKIRLWEKKNPELYHHYRRQMDRDRVTHQHRRRVNIHQFNALMAEGVLNVDWAPWTEEQMFRLGVTLVECIIRVTGWFEIRNEYQGPRKNPLMLTALPGFLEWAKSTMDALESRVPDYWPSLMPPKRWSGTRDGGYWTPYVKAPKLIRFKAHQKQQALNAGDEYDALEMPRAYAAVAVLQETAWRVNKRVLEVVLEAWARDEEIGKLPRVGEVPLPPRTPRMEEHRQASLDARAAGRDAPKPDAKTQEEIDAWKRKASPIYRINAKRISRMRAEKSTVLLAQRFARYPRFYFPHMLDFRGRAYPIPTFLQPQGADLAKGLLTFADGLPVTRENGGAGWLAIHLASVWGNDKVSLDDRIAWVEEREEMWRRIAADPMGEVDLWGRKGTADKPWQALAAVFEWVAYLDHGDGYVSSLPVVVDGTCNGIQHLSALTRDEVSGARVNLVPSEVPQDIYKFVAEGVTEDLQGILEAKRSKKEDRARAEYWLGVCGGEVPRTLTKRQVMVLPYGGTKEAFFKYLKEWLDETGDPVPEEGLDKKGWSLRYSRLSFLNSILWRRVGMSVRGGVAVMEWLKACAKVAAEAGQPIYWIVPSSFVVRHFYGQRVVRRVKLKLEGEVHRVDFPETTATLSTERQLRGIAPNFIHSLDAAAMMLTVEKCKEAGIEDFTSVHDAFGTHAANMFPLNRFIREAFVEVHEHDLLGAYREACKRVLVDKLLADGVTPDPLEAEELADRKLPPPPDMGNLDIRAVVESDYFFA